VIGSVAPVRLGLLALAIIAPFLAINASAQSRGSAWSAGPLTPDGIGLIRIGMTRQQVTRVIGAGLEAEELSEGCVEARPRGNRGIFFMFQDNRLTRISIGAPSRITTPRGIGIGSTEAQAHRAYGSGLQIEPHYYDDAPARYLTFWTQRGQRGVRFETDTSRRVQTIHAGTEAIEYVEGCL
jgi:hypothetical protein